MKQQFGIENVYNINVLVTLEFEQSYQNFLTLFFRVIIRCIHNVIGIYIFLMKDIVVDVLSNI